MFTPGTVVNVRGCQDFTATLVKPLTTQDEVNFLEGCGTELAKGLEYPEIVPNNNNWLTLTEHGSMPISYSIKDDCWYC